MLDHRSDILTRLVERGMLYRYKTWQEAVDEHCANCNESDDYYFEESDTKLYMTQHHENGRIYKTPLPHRVVPFAMERIDETGAALKPKTNRKFWDR